MNIKVFGITQFEPQISQMCTDFPGAHFSSVIICVICGKQLKKGMNEY